MSRRLSEIFRILFYYTGINDGVGKEGFIGRHFRPGLWVLRNILWNSGLAHKYKSAMWLYKVLDDRELRMLKTRNKG